MNVFEVCASISLDDSEFLNKIQSAEKKVQGFGSKIGGALGKVGKVTAGIGAAFAGAAAVGVAALNGLAESTEEYRVAISKLNTAYESVGLGQEAANTAFSEFYKILGDTDTATEASQLLSNLAKSEEDVNKWATVAAGVMGRYGDSIPIEGLIEAANETVKVGEVTGSFADALNWAATEGADWSAALASNSQAQAAFNEAISDGATTEDAFNAALAACADEQERTTLTTEAMLAIYGESAAIFHENNKAIEEARQNQQLFQAAMAGVGEAVTNIKNKIAGDFMPSITTLADVLAKMLNGDEYDPNQLVQGIESFGTAFQSTLDNILGLAVEILPQVGEIALQVIVTFVQSVVEKLPDVIQAAVEIIGALVTGISEALPDLIPAAVEAISALISGFQSMITEFLPVAAEIIASLVTGLAQALPELVPAAIDAVMTIVETLTNPDMLGSLIDAALLLIVSLADGLMQALPRLLDKVPEIIQNLLVAFTRNSPKLLGMGVILIVELAGGLIKAIPQLLKAVPEIISAVVIALAEGVRSFVDVGGQLLMGLWNGMKDKIGWLKDKVSGIVDTIKSWFTSKDGFDEHSPSKWSEEVFSNLLAGGVEGLDEASGSLFARVEDITVTVMDLFTEGIRAKRSEAEAEAFDFVEAVSDIFQGLKKSLDFSQSISGLEYQLWENEYDANNGELYTTQRRLARLQEDLERQGDKVQAAKDAKDKAKNDIDQARTEQRLQKEQEDYAAIQRSIDSVNAELDRLNDQTATEKYHKQLTMLTEQQQAQSSVVAAAAEAYNRIVEEYGAASVESLEYQKQLLEEKAAYQELFLTIQQVSRALSELQEKRGISGLTDVEDYARYAVSTKNLKASQAHVNMQYMPAGNSSSGNSQTVINNVTTVELDGEVLARKMYTYNQNETNRRGASLITA